MIYGSMVDHIDGTSFFASIFDQGQEVLERVKFRRVKEGSKNTMDQKGGKRQLCSCKTRKTWRIFVVKLHMLFFCCGRCTFSGGSHAKQTMKAWEILEVLDRFTGFFSPPLHFFGFYRDQENMVVGLIGGGFAGLIWRFGLPYCTY